MRICLFILAAISSIKFGYSQAVYKAVSGEVTFYSYALVEDIKANSKQLNSFLNTLTGEIAFIIPIRSFRFEKKMMEEHFNEKYMESDKFPQATFKGIVKEKIDLSQSGKSKVTAKGKINIHGIEKEIEETGEIEIRNDTITIYAHFYAPIADFKIKKPQLLFNNIADTIEVKMTANYLLLKKK